MQEIIIVGAGGHAAEVSEYILYSNKDLNRNSFKIIGFLDDNPDSYTKYRHPAPLMGDIKGHLIRHDIHYVIGIANLAYRKGIVERFLSYGATFETVIHPNAYVSESATIGEGVVIGPNVNVGPNVIIGRFNLLNARASMGHDTRLGDYNFICPNVCFSGFTVVGDNNLFGINSATIPGITIGDNNKIAAGMVLNKNVGNDEVVFYRYKESVIAIPR